MDFVTIATRGSKNGGLEVYPKFTTTPSKDLMIRGRDFYAVWLDDQKRWSTNECDLIKAVDNEMAKEAEKNGATYVAWMWDGDSKSIDKFHYNCHNQRRDNWVMLDSKLVFADEPITREDYVTRRLPYKIENGDVSAYMELVGTLYSPQDAQKINWMIGSILSGDSRTREKCYVFYGAPKTGKSTMLKIIEKLFPGYCSAFSAKALGNKSNAFPFEPFKYNPLIAIDYDSNMAKIDENANLNALISHEMVVVNEKGKPTYSAAFQSTLIIATNTYVKITDANSGLLRRVIDINPTGNRIPRSRYDELMTEIEFELGAIANYCIKLFKSNPKAYDEYEARQMLALSNDFYDFMTDMFVELCTSEEVTLAYLYQKYTEYCQASNITPMRKKDVKTELKNYFAEFYERANGNWYVYKKLLVDKFAPSENTVPQIVVKDDTSEEKLDTWIELKHQSSVFDTECTECPAQYATEDGKPKVAWDKVTTKLKDLDTSKVHYVDVPENHIVIDFDIKDDDGKKSLERNIRAASKFPKTYCEVSKSGSGLHLHYIYSGDVQKLSHYYDEQIEIKVFTGGSTLRRKLSTCNDIPIATISSGLPIKEGDKTVNTKEIETENHLRCLIKKALAKEYGSTSCNIDFIAKLLSDAYAREDFKYDVSELQNSVLVFAAGSTNQAKECIKKFAKMKFKSKHFEVDDDVINSPKNVDMSKPIAFFDVEVFPNLFLLVYKEQGKGKKKVRLYNPDPKTVVKLFNDYRMIGFNNRDYDNHICYARMIGYSNLELFKVSQGIIVYKNRNFKFGQAFNLSFSDVYDFASAANKKSLKKWEIELGLPHDELDWDWTMPIPESLWGRVGDYCENDVDATEAVFDHLAEDWLARQILAKITGLTCNDKTNTLTAKFIFGNDRDANKQFNYRNMGDVPADAQNCTILKDGTVLDNVGDPEWNKFDVEGRPWFPGYKFEYGKSWYRGEDPKEGGYVYAEPGIHWNVALLDVESMHPSSAIAEQLFGKYTSRFEDLKTARVLIKHGEYDTVKLMFNGALKDYLNDPEMADGLAGALKTAINAVYGLTSAHFENAFRDPRNVDNIVAKRGALFMINLKHEIQDRGFTVAHIKTDSIKIPNATPEIIKFAMDYARAYGYKFEHEATYEKMCLVNNAVYIAKYATTEWCMDTYGYVPSKQKKNAGKWSATGAEFAHPYIFKSLFSKEAIEDRDMQEVHQANSTIYIDRSETNPDSEKEFVGKIGAFIPVLNNGGAVVRKVENEDGTVKYDSVTGTLGYKWQSADAFYNQKNPDNIDKSYYAHLIDKTIEHIKQYGDYEEFVA